MITFRPRHVLLLLAVLLAGTLAVVVGIRYQSLKNDGPVPALTANLPAGVDLALEQIDYTHTEDGAPRWRLIADRAEHRADDQRIAFRNLALTLYGEDGQGETVLKAGEGSVDKEFTVVDVWGDVVIENSDGYTLRTERLNYQTASRLARTDAPVRLSGKGVQVDAVGAVVDLEKRRLQLLSQVKTVLQPNRQGQGTL